MKNKGTGSKYLFASLFLISCGQSNEKQIREEMISSTSYELVKDNLLGMPVLYLI